VVGRTYYVFRFAFYVEEEETEQADSDVLRFKYFVLRRKKAKNAHYCATTNESDRQESLSYAAIHKLEVYDTSSKVALAMVSIFTSWKLMIRTLCSGLDIHKLEASDTSSLQWS
jgi:hypothetical protein